MAKYQVTIDFETDGLEFEQDLAGICGELKRAFPDKARGYVRLLNFKVWGVRVKPKAKSRHW
jgi:hypothetical protein